MKTFVFILLVGIVIYFGAVIYLYVTQESKIFNRKWAKESVPKVAKKISFKTSDGIILEGAVTKNNENSPLVLYFSGNANNVIEFLDNIAPKIRGFNFIGFNYPGYAGSEGKPCEKCILKYSLEIFDKYKPDIIIGRSLGSAVAAYVASKRGIKNRLLIKLLRLRQPAPSTISPTGINEPSPVGIFFVTLYAIFPPILFGH